MVNPKDVLVTLKNEHGKIRTSAFTILGILEKDLEWYDNAEIMAVLNKIIVGEPDPVCMNTETLTGKIIVTDFSDFGRVDSKFLI